MLFHWLQVVFAITLGYDMIHALHWVADNRKHGTGAGLHEQCEEQCNFHRTITNFVCVTEMSAVEQQQWEKGAEFKLWGCFRNRNFDIFRRIRWIFTVKLNRCGHRMVGNWILYKLLFLNEFLIQEFFKVHFMKIWEINGDFYFIQGHAYFSLTEIGISLTFKEMLNKSVCPLRILLQLRNSVQQPIQVHTGHLRRVSRTQAAF